MNYFCTLFDRNYLYKGLALHQSLLDHGGDFTLWILAMDDVTLKILEKLTLKNVQLIRLADFEDPELLKVKPTRSLVEYFWTLSPSLPLYLLKNNPSLPMITYIDADLFFFSSPQPIFDEFGQRSILLTEHRFPTYLAYKEKESGRFNVQYLTFRHDRLGFEGLAWWRERCLEWCYFRYEDGKLGDQLYLNDWPKRFRGVHILQHPGGGLAPWNVLRYHYQPTQSGLRVENHPLIFYHFHGLKLVNPQKIIYGLNYALPTVILRSVYRPYELALQNAIRRVRQLDVSFNAGFSQMPSFKDRLQSLLISQKLRLAQSFHDYQSTAR